CFVLTPDTTKAEIDYFVEFHRQELQQASGYEINSIDYMQGFRYSLGDLTINRMALYIMAHTFRHYGFMERVFKTLRHLIRLEVGI
ncbi:hypothetical protein JYT19_00330, partial [Sulfobacillus acidophilus]|nr:hypothetical protein [Sulfobacillus acidophilus]